MQREKINVAVKGNWLINGKHEEKEISFVFNAEPNVAERIQIKNEAAELMGGIEKIIGLEKLAFDYYDKHIQLNNDKYGEEGFKNKLAEFEKLKDPKTDEEIAAFNKFYKEIYSNKFYDMYIGLIGDRVRIGDYAFLKVMCVEPESFSFYQQKETELLKIVGEVNEKRKFFRKPAEEPKKDGVA